MRDEEYVIRLIARANGKPSLFDDHYVVDYDPAWHPPGHPYDGGNLTVTSEVERATRFATIDGAFAFWRKSFGLRADGKPNRPLTAWTIEIERAPER